VALREQLLAPWAELADLVSEPEIEAASSLRETPEADPNALLALVHAAGSYRLDRRARRLALRGAAVGRTQAVWEAVAEAFGFHTNQEPFRHLARRLPAAFLLPLAEEERAALLFGVAGFLPEALHRLPAPAAAAARPLWDRWWKARASLQHAVLPPSAWTLARIRPANRPERRLAALAAIIPRLDRLERAVDRRDAAAFARAVAECHDPFWSRHATWRSRPAAKPLHLVGPERIDDLVANLFWPLVALSDGAAAEAGLAVLPGSDNRVLREARRRLTPGLPPRLLRGALLQQGLLQLKRDAGEEIGSLLERWNRL
jgi:hypothetical protein